MTSEEFLDPTKRQQLQDLFKGPIKGSLHIDFGEKTAIPDDFWLDIPENIYHVEIKGNIQTIGNNFFKNCKNLQSLVIEGNVESIGDAFLEGCEKLKSFAVPGIAKRIGKGFMKDCLFLESLKITMNLDVKSIPEDFLGGCQSLINREIEVETQPGAFADEKALAFLKAVFKGITQGLVSINCESAASIPNDFGADASGMREYIENVQIKGNVETIGNQFLKNYKMLKYVKIPNSVKTIGDGFLEGCDSLGMLTDSTINSAPEFLSKGNFSIPIGVELIGNGFLQGCNKIDFVSIPATVWYVGSNFLKGCTNLKNAYFTKNGKMMVFHEGFLADCPNVTVTNDPRKAKSPAGQEPRLVLIKDLPSLNSFENIEGIVMSYRELLALELQKEELLAIALTSKRSEVLAHNPECIVAIDFTELGGVPDGFGAKDPWIKQAKRIQIEGKIQTIGKNFLKNYKNLKEVIIPDSVKTIDIGFLEGCVNLETLELEYGIERIGDEFLSGCKALKKFDIPKTVKRIGSLFIDKTESK